MDIYFETTNHWKGKGEWLFVLPSLGAGYYKKFLSINLYILCWEFSINFEWEE